MANFSFIDLFAGIGGFRLALESVGGHCLGFSEIATDAIRAYCANFNESEEGNFGDITKIKDLPSHDFMTAGVPCQSWSIAGKNLGFDDDRGQLWNDTLYLLNKVRPKTFIFENVKGLSDPRNQKALDYILSRIAQAGYHAKTFVLNAYDYGVPQTRVRIYIVGFKEEKFLKRFQLPKPFPGRVCLNDVLDNKIVMTDVRADESTVKISKVDVNSKELKGALLILTGKDESGADIEFDETQLAAAEDAVVNNNSGKELSWNSGSTETYVKKLKDGTYPLTEDTAPLGYSVTTPMTFTIKDGKLVEDGDNVKNGTVTMIDELAESNTKISKQNLGGEEVPGATLTLTGTDSSGAKIKFVKDQFVAGEAASLLTSFTSEDAKVTELSWESGTVPSEILSLQDGKYVLHEVAAPRGYVVTTNIEFEIKDGKLVEQTGVAQNKTVTMVDDYATDIYISKSDLGGKEVVGAVLTLTGTDNHNRAVEFSKDMLVTGDEANALETSGTTIKWISGSGITNVKNLADGTYILHEEVVPDGYLVATDIEFVIYNGKLVKSEFTDSQTNTVTMTDEYATTIKISKEDIYSNELAGARLTLTGEDKNGTVIFKDGQLDAADDAEVISGSGDKLEWKSGTTQTTVKDLPDGEYVLHEVAAPDGYVVTTDISFKIVNGNIVTDDTRVDTDTNTLTLVDNFEKATVKIEKQDVYSKEIPGATLTLTGKDGDKVISFASNQITKGEGGEIGRAHV